MKNLYIFIFSKADSEKLLIGTSADPELIVPDFRNRRKRHPDFPDRAALLYLEHCPNAETAASRLRSLRHRRNRDKWEVIRSCNPMLRPLMLFGEEEILDSQLNHPEHAL